VSVGAWGRPVAAAILVVFAGCDIVTGGEPVPPSRPSGVPAKAVWAGGIDGGRFLLMSPANPDGTYPLKVYNDYTGELEFGGVVRLDEPSSAPVLVNDSKTFNSWDGDTLLLRDGRSLSPVKRKRKK
jgi:hypothetical protein